jgi:polyisoprenoid-binding protein YceI
MSKIKWSIDPAHSEIHFKAKHLMITTVTGKFGNFEATVETDGDDFNTARIHFSAKVDSISTGQEMRDNHLKSDDFFNAAQFPEIKFDSTQLKRVSGDNFKLEGNLTIRDITRVVELDVEFEGLVVDPYGNTKTGWEIKGKINRKDFNLKWTAVTEAGAIVVSDEIKIESTVQLVKHQVAATTA